ERDPGDAPGVPADASADAEHSHQREQVRTDSRAGLAEADSVGAGAGAGPASGPPAVQGDQRPASESDPAVRPRGSAGPEAHQPGVPTAREHDDVALEG